MSVSFSGFDEKLLTFKNTSAITAGYPVKISSGNTVSACSAGESFCGFVVESDEDYASVRVGGVVTARYSGSAPAVGFVRLAAAGAGRVSTPSSGGREHLVLSVDITAGTLTFIL